MKKSCGNAPKAGSKKSWGRERETSCRKFPVPFPKPASAARASPFPSSTFTPVSYTHLDVYKRQVQDLKPEQAVGVLYLYKSVLRELLLADMLAAGDVQGFLDMGDRLDTLCLMAFNLYLADREQVYAERVAQQRREASQIRRWAARHGLVENQDGE